MSGIFWVLVVIAVLMFVSVWFLFEIHFRLKGTVDNLKIIRKYTRDLRHHVYRIDTIVCDRDFNDVRRFDKNVQPMWDD